MTQTTLDLTAPQARDQAIERVRRANRDWVADVARVICGAAKLRAQFTADDILPLIEHLGVPTDNRALGAAFNAAKNAGIIDPTDRFVPTKRSHCHARPIRIWKSRVFEGASS